MIIVIINNNPSAMRIARVRRRAGRRAVRPVFRSSIGGNMGPAPGRFERSGAFWSEHQQWFWDLRPSIWNLANYNSTNLCDKYTNHDNCLWSMYNMRIYDYVSLSLSISLSLSLCIYIYIYIYIHTYIIYTCIIFELTVRRAGKTTEAFPGQTDSTPARDGHSAPGEGGGIIYIYIYICFFFIYLFIYFLLYLYLFI